MQDLDRAKNWNAILGIPGTQADNDPRVWGVPVVTVNGYAQLGNPYPVPQPRGETNFNALDNISMQHANHALKFGVDFLKMFLNETFTNQGRGAFTFDGTRTAIGAVASANAFADFLLGLPSVSQRAPAIGPPTAYARRYSIDFFAQDDWKVNQKLTINVGVRYEGNAPMHDKYGRDATFDPTLGNGQGGLRIEPNHSRYQAGIDTFQQLYPGLIIQTGTFQKGDWNNFAPRFGFAYTPFGKGQTVVRGGYGVFFQVQNLITATNMTSPFVLSQRFTTVDNITFSNPWGTGVATNSTISAPGFTLNERTPYYQNWNFGIQRELPNGFLIDVSYQGKKGTHMIRSRDINQPFDRSTGIRPYKFFSLVSLSESSGNSNYNGLHFRSEKRASNGLSYIFAYVFGKQIDDVSTSPRDSYNQQLERSVSSADARHRFSWSVVYQLPFGHDRRFLRDAPKPIDYVFGGWELSGISRANSGYRFNATISNNNSGTGDNRDHPDQVHNPNGNSTPSAWWDRTAFVLPAKGSFGNAGRNTLVGPSLWTEDISLVKAFKPRERQTMQLRVEMFNAFNHANFNDPATNFSSLATFGNVSGAFAARQIQLGFKWIF
jgi:hypothetical protein